MHDYHIRKHITLRKKNPFNTAVNVFILLIAVPVIAISVVSLLLYVFFIWLITPLKKNKNSESGNDHYHYEIELLNNKNIRIVLEEDELDIELSHLNELWMENIYNRETCLYRAKTTPRIEELDGKIVCFYKNEKPEGAILQVLNEIDFDKNSLHTQLVFLYYHTLQVAVIDDTGGYYLYNDEKNANLITGFNKKEKIQMEIIRF